MEEFSSGPGSELSLPILPVYEILLGASISIVGIGDEIVLGHVNGNEHTWDSELETRSSTLLGKIGIPMFET